MMGPGILKDFFADAVFGGMGAFLVFVPRLWFSHLLSASLKTAATWPGPPIIVHRPLSAFGLTGKSFVPYLSGFACAIPAMMAARTIESPKKRLMTIHDHSTDTLLGEASGVFPSDHGPDSQHSCFGGPYHLSGVVFFCSFSFLESSRPCW